MVEDENPYAAPQTQSFSEPDGPLPQIWVEGRFLVVADGVTLPDRCVFTNEPVNEPLLVQTFKWAPSFRPVISAKQIRLTFAVNLRRQQKQRRNRYIGVSLQALGAVLLYKATGSLLPLTFIIASGALILLAKPTYLLVSKCKNDRFWLKGCGPEFLASCTDEFGTRHHPER